MTDAWQQLSTDRSGWFWIASALRNGDLYHVCCLAAAFRKHFGVKHPIYLIVARQSQSSVAELFREDFGEIIVADDLPIWPDEWDVFFQSTSLPRFGRDVPLLLHPNFYEWGQAAIEMAAQTHRTWMDIYKKILRLPGDCEPSVPAFKPDLKKQALAFCLSAKIPAGRSVILFPYAQSLPMPTSECFAKLSGDLHLDGFAVYTSVAGDETPIDGTIGLSIPFSLLIEVAEYCGWVVAIRSGICDITSSARCRRTYIYPSFQTLVAWSVNAMDLARDAQEISYPFTGDPSYFSYLVRSSSNLSPLAAYPRRLSNLLTCDNGPSVFSVSFFDCCSDDLHQLCQDLKHRIKSALVIYDVPSRVHPRLDKQARTLATKLEKFCDGLSVYACRDALPSSFLENINGFPLLSGRYVAAEYWHSLIVVTNRVGSRIADLLPSFARDALLLPSQAMSTNDIIRPGDYLGSAEHIDATSQARPLSIEGVQFLEGWSDLEAWGLWSEGLQPTIKLFTKEPLKHSSTLYVEANGCVSSTFPEISLSVSVNGATLDRVAIHAPFGNRFEVPLGEHLCGRRVATIVFRMDEIRSPFEQGSSQDNRKLGLGLVAVELRDTPQPSAALQDATRDLNSTWQRLTGDRPAGSWWWLSQIAHQGDLYAMCTLARAFRRIYGHDAPLRLVIGEQSRVPELFEDAFDEIIVAPEMNGSVEDWVAFRSIVGRGDFGLDRPLVLFPTVNPDTYFVEKFASDNHVSWIQIYKQILRLPPGTKPELGQSANLRKQAFSLCQNQRILQHKSVVLAPYARSCTVDTVPHFSHLAETLNKMGFMVVTSCAPQELPIPGTQALFIPLPMMLYAAEYAGWFVGVRSGVCDIVSSAPCKKTIIYGSSFPMEVWGLDRLGFCQDAHQIDFEFLHNSPHEFVSLVLDESFGQIPGAEPPRQSTKLNGVIGLGAAFGSSAHRAAVKTTEPLQVDGLLFKEGWWNLEPWGMWGRGSSHVMVLNFDLPPTMGFCLEIAVQPIASGTAITVDIDGVERGRSYVSTSDAHVILASFVIDSAREVCKTEFEVSIKTDVSRTPLELSDGAIVDTRIIGVGLLWIKVIPT